MLWSLSLGIFGKDGANFLSPGISKLPRIRSLHHEIEIFAPCEFTMETSRWLIQEWPRTLRCDFQSNKKNPVSRDQLSRQMSVALYSLAGFSAHESLYPWVRDLNCFGGALLPCIFADHHYYWWSPAKKSDNLTISRQLMLGFGLTA